MYCSESPLAVGTKQTLGLGLFARPRMKFSRARFSDPSENPPPPIATICGSIVTDGIGSSVRSELKRCAGQEACPRSPQYSQRQERLRLRPPPNALDVRFLGIASLPDSLPGAPSNMSDAGSRSSFQGASPGP